MEKCLVKTLKGSISDNTLPIFGQIEITFTPAASGQAISINTSQYSAFVFSGETNLKLVGNGTFLKGNDQSDLGKDVTLYACTGLSKDGVILNSTDGTELKLIINSLYNIVTAFNGVNSQGFPNLPGISEIKGFESIKYLPLTALRASHCSQECDITNLSNPANTLFYWRETSSLTGNIKEFGKCILLREINCLNVPNLTGSVEEMVEQFAANGLEDGAEIKCVFNNNNKISFHGVSGSSSLPYIGTFYVSRSGSSYIVTQSSTTKGTYTVGSGWSYT